MGPGTGTSSLLEQVEVPMAVGGKITGMRAMGTTMKTSAGQPTPRISLMVLVNGRPAFTCDSNNQSLPVNPGSTFPQRAFCHVDIPSVQPLIINKGDRVGLRREPNTDNVTWSMIVEPQPGP
jgi:hypothetical protein